MASIFDVDQTELIEKAAEELKKLPEIKAPEWALFVKTGVQKERPPVKTDWWYVRAASILRRIYLKGPVGVSKLRTLYGGKKNRGMKPEKFMKGSGNIIRKILQQLEKAGLAKQAEKGTHKGRIVTPKGKSLLDKSAVQIQKSSPKKAEAKPKKAEVKKEEKLESEIPTPRKEASRKPAEQKPQQEKNG